MLKQFVRPVLLLVALVTLVVNVSGQSLDRFKVNVPFQFVLNGRTLPAGTYLVERTDPARRNLLTIKKADGGVIRAVITQRVEKDTPSSASSLVFIQREGKRYLFQVWNVGALSGGQIPLAFEKNRNDRQREAFALLTLKATH